jgi:hypothetical protein
MPERLSYEWLSMLWFSLIRRQIDDACQFWVTLGLRDARVQA